MSSIFSTQNRQTFLRRKYCFLPAIALSPPVGRMEPLMGRPPLVSAMVTPCPQLLLLERVPREPDARSREPPERQVREPQVREPPLRELPEPRVVPEEYVPQSRVRPASEPT